MSKLPPSSLWPRGASARSALRARSSTSGHGVAAAARSTGSSAHGLALVVRHQHSMVELAGAVVAPFCGPQPKAVAEHEAFLAADEAYTPTFVRAPLLAPQPIRRYFSASYAPSSITSQRTHDAALLVDASVRLNLEAPHLQRLIAEMMMMGSTTRGSLTSKSITSSSSITPPEELTASGGSQSHHHHTGFTIVAPQCEVLTTLPAARSTGTWHTSTPPNPALGLLHLGARQSSSSASDSTPPSSSTGIESDWQGAFNAPRSARHNFTLQHGAYGIPKRHPLSAVRAAAGRREKLLRDSEAGITSPPPPPPKSRLAQAADFLTGATSAPPPPPKTSTCSSTQLPVSAQEARRAALHQGSTPTGEEALETNVTTGKYAARAIRDAKGSIVRERLRSVQVGEDAYFLRPDSLGVADGVGGWASRPGADPALFSRLLMHFCAVELSRYDKLSAAELSANGGALLAAWSSVDPVEVMHHAWERCVRASRREGILGSSTALLALLRGDELRIANVGDCVLLIIREGDLLFRSEEQQHSFNFPVQLGMMGETAESIDKRRRAGHAGAAATEGSVGDQHADEDYDDPHPDGPAVAQSATPPVGTGEATQSGTAQASEASPTGEDDEPEWDEPRRDAGRYTVTVQRGDIIIVGSDGLMDNLFDEDILEEVLRFAPWPAAETAKAHARNEATSQNVHPLPEDFSPQLVSEALCSRAKAVSEDSRAISSPFQQRAVEEGLHYVGGKHDDISVLVAVIKGDDDGLVSGLSSATASESTASSTASQRQSQTQQAAAMQQQHL